MAQQSLIGVHLNQEGAGGEEESCLTFTAARHMSATIRPATLVSNIFEMAKLKTFSKAT